MLVCLQQLQIHSCIKNAIKFKIASHLFIYKRTKTQMTIHFSISTKMFIRNSLMVISERFSRAHRTMVRNNAGKILLKNMKLKFTYIIKINFKICGNDMTKIIIKKLTLEMVAETSSLIFYLS